MAFAVALPASGQNNAKKNEEPLIEKNYDAKAAELVGKLRKALDSICPKPMLFYMSSIGEHRLNDEIGNVDGYLAKLGTPQEKASFLISRIGRAKELSVKYYYEVYAENYASGYPNSNAPNIRGFSVPDTMETKQIAAQAMYCVVSGTAAALSADSRSPSLASLGNGLGGEAGRIFGKINWKNANSIVDGIKEMHIAQEEYAANASITLAKISRINKIGSDYGLPQWASRSLSDLEDASGVLLVLGAAAISIRKGDAGKAAAAVTALFGAMGAQSLVEGAKENDWRKIGLGLALMMPVGRMAAMARGAGWASSFGAEVASAAGGAYITSDMLQNIYNTSRLGFSTSFTDENLRSVISDASMLFAPHILHIQLERQARNVKQSLRARYMDEISLLDDGKATRSFWEGLQNSENQSIRALSGIVAREIDAKGLENVPDKIILAKPVRVAARKKRAIEQKKDKRAIENIFGPGNYDIYELIA